jgi:hypothetical protein
MVATFEGSTTMTRWITMLGLAALLAACSHGPVQPQGSTAAQDWNGGTWNSVLGYHGPANARVVNAPQ